MELQDLALKERLLLSLRVQHDSARFFQTLAATLKPADAQSTEFLEGLAVDEAAFDEQLSRLDLEVPWPSVLHLDEHAICSILHKYLPELYRWVAVRGVSPKNALRLARDIEREIADFHEALARGCQDADSKTLLEGFSQKERSHLSRLVDSVGASDEQLSARA